MPSGRGELADFERSFKPISQTVSVQLATEDHVISIALSDGSYLSCKLNLSIASFYLF